MDFSDLAKITAFSGFWLLVQLAAAAFAWHRLRQRSPAWRLVGAALAFMVPVVALIGLLVSSRLQHFAVDKVAQVVKSSQQASNQAAPPRQSSRARQSNASAMDHTSAMDPARLLSPDLDVRFNTGAQAGRQLNIPKVVE